MRWFVLLLSLCWPLQAAGQTTTASVAVYSQSACADYREAAILNAAAADKAEIDLRLERVSHQATKTELVKAKDFAETRPTRVTELSEGERVMWMVGIAVAAVAGGGFVYLATRSGQ